MGKMFLHILSISRTSDIKLAILNDIKLAHLRILFGPYYQ